MESVNPDVDSDFSANVVIDVVPKVVPTNLPVSVILAKQYFKMAKQIEYKLEHCPICLDELNCPNCFTLLPCSHYLCAPCYMRMQDKKCPICRAE